MRFYVMLYLWDVRSLCTELFFFFLMKIKMITRDSTIVSLNVETNLTRLTGDLTL